MVLIVVLGVGIVFGFSLRTWMEPSPDDQAFQESMAASTLILNQLLREPNCENELWRKQLNTFLHQLKYISIAEKVGQASITEQARENYEYMKAGLLHAALDELHSDQETSYCSLFVQEIGIYSQTDLKPFERGT